MSRAEMRAVAQLMAGDLYSQQGQAASARLDDLLGLPSRNMLRDQILREHESLILQCSLSTVIANAIPLGLVEYGDELV